MMNHLILLRISVWSTDSKGLLSKRCYTGAMSINQISVSGLLAQGAKVNGIARNIANINTPNYEPVDIISISQENGGVTTAEVPAPDASIEDQLIGLITAKTSYQADAKLIKIQRDMDKDLLDIIT